jgi:hypothetical protein
VRQLGQILDLRIVDRVHQREHAAAIARAMDAGGDFPAREIVRDVDDQKVWGAVPVEYERKFLETWGERGADSKRRQHAASRFAQ